MALRTEDAIGRQSHQIIVADPPKFDLDIYISNFDGLTRLSRLSLIGACSRYFGQEALHLAIIEAQQGKNVSRYLELTQELYAIKPSDPRAQPDQEWVDSKTRQVALETERLENELKGYKNNLIKESIRMGNEDLGAFYYDIGDFSNAFKAYSRMREYCTTPKHLCEMSLKLLLTAIAQNNWMQVQSNALKIQNLQLKSEDKSRIDPLIEPMLGLASLASNQYRDAAGYFISANPSWIFLDPAAGIAFNRQALSANDVAIYGGLCALATMNRADLLANVLNNVMFRHFLELEPHIRRAITCFCGSKYTQCLEILEAYRNDYLLDLYLQRHVEPLYAQIRRKCIVAYLAPYSRMGLASMASAFKVPSAAHMQAELADMIEAGLLEAKLDLVENVVVAETEDRREVVHAKALKMAAEHERSLRLRLFRINVLEAGLDIKAVKEGGGAGGGMDGGKSMGGFGKRSGGMTGGISAGGGGGAGRQNLGP